jgi:predicted HicB family RNase H-like nuclease
MNTSHYLARIHSDLLSLGQLGGPEMIAMTERLLPAMSPILQQRLVEQITLLVAEHNQLAGAIVLELRMTPDELQLVTPQLAPTTTEPIGELDARFALRLPTDLKERIDQLAGAEGISANTWMIRTLSTAATNPSPTQHGHFRIGSTMRGRGKS